MFGLRGRERERLDKEKRRDRRQGYRGIEGSGLL